MEDKKECPLLGVECIGTKCAWCGDDTSGECAMYALARVVANIDRSQRTGKVRVVL